MGGTSGGDGEVSWMGNAQQVIFIDANVFVYVVGRPHPLKEPARKFFIEANQNRTPLFTSAEVLQELAHVFLSVGRSDDFDDARDLSAIFQVQVWPLEEEDVAMARQLYQGYPYLGARDLCRLASCRRRGVSAILRHSTGDLRQHPHYYEGGATLSSMFRAMSH